MFWDFDHTLAWREGGWSKAVCDVLRREMPDLRVTREQISVHLQSGFPWHEPDQAHLELRNSDVWWAALKPVFVVAMAAQGVDQMRAMILATHVRDVYLSHESWRLYDDALETMRALHDAGWTQVLLSNHVPELPQLVSGLGLAPWLDGIVGSAETGYEKPNPKAYAIALERHGPADLTCMVGDSMRCDVLPPLSLGWQAILVHWQERGSVPDPRAPFACRELCDVLEPLPD